MLAALSIELGTLDAQLESPEAARVRLSSIEARVESLSDEVRRISHQLHPSILEHAGFVAALRSHCQAFGKQTEINVRVSTNNVPERIDPMVASSLFRLSQEALQNVAKHSSATEVIVTVAGDGEGIEISIVDNGKGFDLSKVRKLGGLGLVSMKERAHSLGGRLSIRSSPQRGATIEVWVPLEQPAGPEGSLTV